LPWTRLKINTFLRPTFVCLCHEIVHGKMSQNLLHSEELNQNLKN
jgi:hypothetical protein